MCANHKRFTEIARVLTRPHTYTHTHTHRQHVALIKWQKLYNQKLFHKRAQLRAQMNGTVLVYKGTPK